MSNVGKSCISFDLAPKDSNDKAFILLFDISAGLTGGLLVPGVGLTISEFSILQMKKLFLQCVIYLVIRYISMKFLIS